MARPSVLSDHDLRSYLDVGMTQAQIARLARVSESAISQRVAALDRREAAMADPRAVQDARTSVWDVRAKIEWCQDKAEDILNNAAFDPKERIAALNSIVAQCRFVITSLSTLYSIEEQQAFQDAVLDLLDEFDPSAREKVLARLAESRPIRAALLGGGGAVPPKASFQSPPTP